MLALVETVANILIIVMLAAPVARYTAVFQVAEPTLHTPLGDVNIGLVTGIAFGVAYEGATWVGLQTSNILLRRPKPPRRWWLPAASAVLQIAVGAVIIVPAQVARLRSLSLPQLLVSPLDAAWSALVVLAVSLGVLTLSLSKAALARRGELSDAHEPARASSQQEQASSERAARGAERADSTGERARSAAVRCQLCGRTFASKQALAGHLRACPNRRMTDEERQRA
jgi:hypothetical protein